jgi:AcrR family transcriptional regulator
MGDRRRDILLAAAELFARKGFTATSMRDIAEVVGLTGGSLYHHTKSKEELFLEVHGEALRVAGRHLREAAATETDPWLKLRAICRAHLDIQLDPESLTVPLMGDLAFVSPDLHRMLVAQRDAFEEYFRDLVTSLPMKPSVDRNIFRLSVLTLLNNAVTWYRKGRLAPVEVADQIFEIFYQSAESSS